MLQNKTAHMTQPSDTKRYLIAVYKILDVESTVSILSRTQQQSHWSEV